MQLPRFNHGNPIHKHSVPWTQENGFACPLWALITVTGENTEREQSTLTLVTPYWPSAIWFPTLRNLALHPPLLIQSQDRPHILQTGLYSTVHLQPGASAAAPHGGRCINSNNPSYDRVNPCQHKPEKLQGPSAPIDSPLCYLFHRSIQPFCSRISQFSG